MHFWEITAGHLWYYLVLLFSEKKWVDDIFTTYLLKRSILLFHDKLPLKPKAKIRIWPAKIIIWWGNCLDFRLQAYWLMKNVAISRWEWIESQAVWIIESNWFSWLKINQSQTQRKFLYYVLCMLLCSVFGIQWDVGFIGQGGKACKYHQKLVRSSDR